MAIYLNFINVIVPITNIEKHFNVSFDVFFDSYSRDGRYKAMSGLKYYDKYLFATGHMDMWHVEEIVKNFEKEGFISTVKIDGKEHFKDTMIGHIPRSDNKHIFRLLEQGKDLVCTIREIDPDAEIWQMCKVKVELVG